jgi:hypothetical protein
MSLPTVLLPLFVEVILTFALLLWLGVLRRDDFNSGKVRPQQIALREPNWPARTQQVAYCFSNQFELPVLFYLLTVLAILTRHADFLFVVLAWVFVASRLGHAYVHTTSNVVLRRGVIYMVGAVVLMAMWLIFMIDILLGLP